MTEEEKEIQKMNVALSVYCEQREVLQSKIKERYLTELSIKFNIKETGNRSQRNKAEKLYKEAVKRYNTQHNKANKLFSDLLKNTAVYENGTHGILVSKMFDYLDDLVK